VEVVIELSDGVGAVLLDDATSRDAADRRDAVVIATSGSRLGAPGERTYPLRPLAESPAVELFRRRADAASPGFDAAYGELAGRHGLGFGREVARHAASRRIRERMPEDVHRLRRLRRHCELFARARIAHDDAQRVVLSAPEERDLDPGTLAGSEFFDVSCARH